MFRAEKGFLIFWITLILSLPSPSFAEEPESAVRQLLDSIRMIKDGEDISAKQKKINQKLSDLALARLDITEVSRKTLGHYWENRTPTEQEQFVQLLSNLFVKEAFPNSGKFFAELALVYGKPKMKNASASVPVMVIHQDEGEVEIDFHMLNHSGKWRVVDVDLDGISMRNNLRSQFYKIIGKHDYKELIRRMGSKLKDLKSNY